MKSWILAVSLLITNMAMGQTIAEGLHFIDRDQPTRAKQVFESLVAASPTGENYYYLGYYYLSRRDWAAADDIVTGRVKGIKPAFNTINCPRSPDTDRKSTRLNSSH